MNPSQMPDPFSTVFVRDEALPLVTAVLAVAAWCFRYRKRKTGDTATVTPMPQAADPVTDRITGELREAA